MPQPFLRIVVCWLACGLGFRATCAVAAEQHNVLFIVVDDLNDWVGSLGGHPQAKTPHIDALAARGTNFTRAYCAAPICNASRTALLTGLRPSSSGIYGNGNDWRPVVEQKQLSTLNAHFRSQGYTTIGAGKIFHEEFPSSAGWDACGPDEHPPVVTAERLKGGRVSFGPVDAPEATMEDARNVDYCVAQLQEKHEKPLFLACGIRKPHLSWFVPRPYFDKFVLDDVQLPPVVENDLDDVPPFAHILADPTGDHRAMLKTGRWAAAVRGYLAAVAFADAMVGRLIAGFDGSRYRDDTIIVLWGDHGFHLGEKEHWSKNTLWEESTRAPLVFVVPGVGKPGARCERTVDFMSVYPTLCDLCGVPTPSHVEGPSLRPLLENPAAPWDRPALTTRGQGNHAVRTEGWRYIRYSDGTEELYDEKHDPLEGKNLAADASYATIKAELARHLPTSETAPIPKAKVVADTPAEKKKLAERKARSKAREKAAAEAAKKIDPQK